MKVKTAGALIILVFLSGCLPTSVIDDILMVEAEGYDYIGDGKVLGTATMPNYVESGNQGGQGAGLPSTAAMMSSVSGVTYDSKSLIDKFQSKGQRPLRLGKVRIMIFNKRMARHGLKKELDFRNRDPETGRDMQLAVVDGSTNKLLTAQYQTTIPVSRYLTDMIDQNQEQNYPKSNLHQVLYSYYGNYMDPFMPMIRKEGMHLEMRGIALFRNDKYVMTLPEKNVFLFKMLFEKFNQGVYDYQYSPGKHVVIRNVYSTVSYKVRNGNGAEPEIFAKVRLMGDVRQSAPHLLKKDYHTKVEKGMERDIEERAFKMVEMFQKKRIDPLRLGDLVRSYTRQFDGASWDERYPHAHFHCSVHVNIMEMGVSQ
ncbi:Ger(x)C family spore germination protein [Sporolactobacillus sp. THM7-4]|nr:Ger(x)C family spore germination protein [Sporolactobacillus sp. THM7-4]